jgi:probable F420-dependent oxidoreductase
MVQIGVVFPQTEIGNDIGAIRNYIQSVEGMGYTHLLAYDHVLGASVATRPNWTGPYTSDTPFHEVFSLFSYAAAITTRLQLVTGVLILPQRQTALVAKQAAQVDLFSGGRFRLGIGTGWNQVEYEVLNEDFHNRGKRSEEQIAVLRALWTQEVVHFEGQWHHINAAGINPLPVQRPIPIWIGGEADAVLQRIARIGDGWFPQSSPDAARPMMENLHRHIEQAGRKIKDVGIEPRLTLSRLPQEQWGDFVQQWAQLGATHLSINTMSGGLKSPDDHVKALEQARKLLNSTAG